MVFLMRDLRLLVCSLLLPDGGSEEHKIKIANNGRKKKNTIMYAAAIRRLRDASLANPSASEMGMNCNGQKTTVPYRLNKRCANAHAIAAAEPVPNAASIAVIVVPMLAPKVYE